MSDYPTPSIAAAVFPDDAHVVLDIFREYVLSPKQSLAYQDYEAEFAKLPGDYAAPGGGILLARLEGRVVACAAIRPVDAAVCELKRVYVRPVARGLGLGRQMVTHAMGAARAMGYGRMCLDVLPEFEAARALYASLGFVTAEPVSHNPVPGTAFLGRGL